MMKAALSIRPGSSSGLAKMGRFHDPAVSSAWAAMSSVL
jgi:hypothetical protein